MFIAVYGFGGIVCGFLLGVATLRKQLERIVDAVYSTIRAMISSVITGAETGAQVIPADQLRRLMESGTRVWLTNFSKNFGSAKRLFSWIITKPIEKVRTAVLSDLLPALKERNISATAVEEFLRQRVSGIVRVPVEAKLKMLQFVGWAIGILALVLPFLVLTIR